MYTCMYAQICVVWHKSQPKVVAVLNVINKIQNFDQWTTASTYKGICAQERCQGTVNCIMCMLCSHIAMHRLYL